MERRLTAIVAADVVNYSILIGKNDFGTLCALNKIQKEIFVPAVTQYSGRVVRLMGDGSLLAFDSALNAVQFAFDVQRILAERKITAPDDIPINFRMGANLGDIVLDDDDIHGEGINVAVRLEELAPPGGLCLSHGLYLQTKHACGEELLPIGERQLKNIAEPVLVWQWEPPGTMGAAAAQAAARQQARRLHGRHILDPKVTSLLIDLHMRSAQLALLEAFDDLLARGNGGRRLSLREIHQHFSARLNDACELLYPILVEPSAERSEPPRRPWPPQSMSEFIAHALNGGDIFFAAEMIKRIKAVLRSDETGPEKRAAFSRLCHDFLRKQRLPQVKKMIKCAFVEG
jgi:class 3 adenylate cyclase